ncbi:oxygen-independent coproporphyrinogen III oxidase [Thalassotalea sp. LPB0316]|uniref:oxygen-independent coproporphyrinogen III oxidase n=1 Tax=Thalassotalea sp. LPB0316 TaxID=2769490 RepID=UPI0018679C1D|nr:oxygen-independent coproporphyrinogen III oxidase [Thalassotalea sp. LPB0316]QOL26178.1 oxygen-independent coproporphyrinogen III oxidase [Thalassotalea sp. LPB0316]
MTTNISHFFDKALLAKYNTSGPRYTSYPTALEFDESFDETELIKAIEQSSTDELSLYVHIPFCHSLCYYCGCNKIVTRHQDKADIYLDYLIKEIGHRAPLFKKYHVRQLHLGGGTPSFLTNAQLTRLINVLKQRFDFIEQAELSIEIDPREIEVDKIDELRALGFNRISIGVQDIDSKVQEAINRVQSTEFIGQLIARAKALEFDSVNVDLIYGLPHQNQDTFAKTLAQVKAFDVDRISLFSYAHLPSRFAAQRKLKDEWLPDADAKLNLMRQAIETLTDYGYDFIGMDHFAKPTDELSMAQKLGRLHRNFQGYTTKGECDLLGLGVSSISAIGNSFSQNIKDLTPYYQAIDEREHALEKGIALSKDDLIRGDVIRELMCNLFLDKQAIEAKHNIEFDRYFDQELTSLQTFIDDGLVDNANTTIMVSPRARLLIRNICMSFDAYMKRHLNQQRFSRVI